MSCELRKVGAMVEETVTDYILSQHHPEVSCMATIDTYNDP